MVSVVGGEGLGLFNAFAVGTQRGGGGVDNGEAIAVNATTGNLVLRRTDEWLAGRGLDAQILRTYNSQGRFDDDNGDGFRFSFNQRLKDFVAGVSIVRVNGDGHESLFVYDAVRDVYVSTGGEGAHDTLSYDGTLTWTYVEGDSGLTETYAWSGGVGYLSSQLDREGLGITAIGYDGSQRVISLADSSGQQLVVTRDVLTGDVTGLTASSDGVVQSRVSYTYETYDTDKTRLQTVVLDLTPEDDQDAASFTTTYTYLNSTSALIASIARSDGTVVGFDYDGSDHSARISRITVGAGLDAQVTEYEYFAGRTDVKQRLATGVYAVTSVHYDGAGRITSVVTPPDANGQRLTTSYQYDAAGNVIKSTDARGGWTHYSYDGQGNLILAQNSLGETRQWTYDASNRLLNEIAYTGRDATPGDGTTNAGMGDGINDASGALVTRYVYDTAGRLRFVVGNDGSVEERRYSDSGAGTAATRQVTAIGYAAHRYAGAELSDPLAAIALDDLEDWVDAIADKSGTSVVETLLDFRGQVREVTAYGATQANGEGDSATAATTYSLYDQYGRLLRTVDARGSGIADTAYDTVYAYDGLGRLLSVSRSVDALADESITTLYDDANRRIVTEQANGLRIASVYSGAGLVTSTQELDGSTALSTTQYVYDNTGLLRSVIDPVGGTAHYCYDQLGRQVGVIDGTGALTETVYDGNGQITKLIRYAGFVAAGAIAALAADAADGVLAAATAVDPLDGLRPAADAANDRIEQNLYDAAGRLWCAIGAAGSLTEFRYDGAGRLLRTVEHAVAPGVLSGLYGDAPVLASGLDGETILSGYVLPDTSSVARIEARLYDAASSVLVAALETDPAVYEALHGSGSYDGRILLSEDGALAAGRYRVELAFYDAAERLLGEDLLVVGVGEPAQFRLADGRFVTATAAGEGLAGTDRDRVVEYFYDAAGRLRGLLEAGGRYTTYRYNAAGQVVETVRHGAAVSPAQAAADAVPAQAGDIHTYAVYDRAGRLVAEIDGEGYVTTRSYAVGGLLETVRRHDRSIARAGSPDDGLLAQALADVDGDPARLTLLAIEPGADAQRDAVITYSYDTRSRLATVTDAQGVTTVYAYNGEGQLLSESLIPAGAEPPALPGAAALYDLQGRLAELRDARYFDATDSAYGQAKITFANDALGRRISSTDALGNTTRYIYDAEGRLHYEVNAAREVLIHQYNGFGEQATLARSAAPLPSELALTDADIAAHLAATEPAAVETRLFHDRLGRVEYAVDGLGLVTAYRYDARGNVMAITRYAEALPGYAGLTAADRDAVAEFAAAQSTATALTEYRLYDDLDQLRFAVDALGGVTEYRYDGLGALVQEIGHAMAAGAWVARDALSFAEFYAGVATANLQQQFAYWRGRLAARLAALASAVTPLVREDWAPGSAGALYDVDDWDEIKARLRAGVAAQGRALAAGLADQFEQAELDLLAQLLRFGEGQGIGVAMGATEPAEVAASSMTGSMTLVDSHPGLNGVFALPQRAGETLAAYVERAFIAAGERLIAALVQQADDNEAMTLGLALPDPLVNPENFTDPRPLVDLLAPGALDGQTAAVQETIGFMPLILLFSGVAPASFMDVMVHYDTVSGQMVMAAPAQEGVPEVTGYGIGLAVTDEGAALDALDRYLAAVVGAAAQQANRHRFYDALGRPVHEVDALGYVTTHAYDAQGRVTATSRYHTALWDGETTVAERQALTGTAVADFAVAQNLLADSRSTTAFVYDAGGRLSYRIDALGYVTGYGYDERGRAVTETVYAQALADVDAFLVAQGVPPGPASHSYRYYDAAGQLRHAVDALGGVTRYDYDANGRIIRATRFADSLWSWSDPVLGSADGGSRPGAALLADFIAETGSGRAMQQFVYDAANRLSAEIDAEGTVTTYTYDTRGNALSRRVYNQPLEGALADFLAAQSAPDASVVEQALYDAANRAIYRVDASGVITAYSYDANGQVTGSITYAMPLEEDIAAFRADPAAVLAAPRYAAALASYQYYERGQPQFTIDRDGVFTEYRYDARGNLIALAKAQWRVAATGAPLTVPMDERPSAQQLADFAASQGAVRVALATERYAYDAENRLRYTIDAAGLATEYRYDGAGAVIATFRHLQTVPAWLTIDIASLEDFLAQLPSARLAAQLQGHWQSLLERWPATLAEGWDAIELSLFGESSALADAANWPALEAEIAAEAAARAQALIAQLKAVYGDDYAFIEEMLRVTDGRALTLAADSREVAERIIADTSFFTDMLGNVLHERFDPGIGTYYVTIDAENVETVYEGSPVEQHVSTWSIDTDPADLALSSALAWQPGENLAQHITRRLTAAAQQLIDALHGRTDSAESFSFTLGGLNVQNFADLAADPNVLAALAAIGFTGSLSGLTLTATTNPFAALSGGGPTLVNVSGPRDVLDGVPELAGFGFTAGWVADLDSLAVAPESPPISQLALARWLEPPSAAASRQFAYYDARGQLRYSVDANGRLTAFDYDHRGNQVARRVYHTALFAAGAAPAERPALASIEAFIADLEALATPAQPAAAATSFHYDGLGRLAYTVDGAGHVIGYAYDSQDRVIATTVFQAPLAGELAAFAAAEFAASDRSYTYYDKAGRAIYQIDALGYVTRNEHDARGNVVRASVFHASLWDEAGTEPQQRPDAAVVAAFIAAQAEHCAVQTFAYDGNGRVVRSTDADGVSTVFRYDVDGNLQSRVRLEQAAGTRLDPLFNAGNPVLTPLAGEVADLAMVRLPDGRLVVSGTVQGSGGKDLVLVRYLANGTLDASFGDGGVVIADIGTDETAGTLILQGDGKLVLAGSRTVAGDQAALLVRFQADGSLDAGFGSGGVVSLGMAGQAVTGAGVVQQADGALVLLANAGVGGPAQVLLARYAADGSADASFGSGGVATVQLPREGMVHTLLQRPDGRLLAAGYGLNAASADYETVQVQLLADGTPDSGFGSGGIALHALPGNGGMSLPLSAALQADGKLVVGGYAYMMAGEGYELGFLLLRYHADGSLDTGFGDGGRVFATGGRQIYDGGALLVQADGKLVIGGADAQSGEQVLMRFEADGSLDIGFGVGGVYVAPATGMVGAAGQQADGMLVVVARTGALASDTLALLRLETAEATGPGEHFLHDAAGRLRHAVDAEGYITAYDYDGLGQVTTVTRYRDPLAVSVAALRADPEGVLANAVIEAREHSYHGGGRRILSVDAEGYVTRYAYNALGQVVAATISDRSLWTQPALDAAVRPDAAVAEAFLAAREQAAGNAVASRHYVYDARGGLRFTVGDDGRLEETRYDAAGQVVQRIGHAFTVAPNVERTEAALAALVAAAGAVSGDFVYLDGRGQERFRLDSAGFVTAYAYDEQGNVARVTRYRTSLWTTAAPAAERPAEAAIDAFIAAEELAIAGGADRASVARFAHDGRGQLRYQIDGEGYATRYDYDALGRMVRLQRFATPVPAALAEVGDLDALFDAAAPDATTRFFYEGTRLWSMIDAAGGVVVFGYDGAGNVVRTERFTAATTAENAADLQSFIETQRVITGAVAVARSVYDANGRELFSIDAGGFVTRHAYDAAGRRVLTEQFTAAYAPAEEAGYSEAALQSFAATAGASRSRLFYDGLGRARLYLDSEGYATLNSFDAAGNVRAAYRALEPIAPALLATLEEAGYTAIAYAILGGELAAVAEHRVYDDLGQEVLRGDETGVLVSTAYDAQGRVVSTVRHLPAAPLPDTAALMAAAGLSVGAEPTAAQLLAIEDLIDAAFRARLDGAERVAQTLYRYDAVHQRQYAIDALGQVTESVHNADGSVAYTLRYANVTIPSDVAWDATLDLDSYIAPADRSDPANRKTVFHYDHNGALRYTVDALGYVTEQRYDDAGRMVMAIAYAQPLAGPETSDFSGLDLGAAHITRHAYDGVGQLRFTSTAGGQLTERRYDGLGNLIESVEWNVDAAALSAFDTAGIDTLLAAGAEGALTRFDYDRRGYLIAERDGYRVARSGASETLDAGLARANHYLHDAFGRVRYAVDALGFVTGYAYDGLGNVIGGTQYAGSVSDLAALRADPETVLAGHAVLGRFHHYYDGAGNLTAEIDASGYVKAHRYDARGNLIETRTHAVALWSAAAGAALDRVQRPDEATLAAFFAEPAARETQRFVHDAQNRLAFTIDGGRRVTGYAYDAQGTLIQQVTYDALLPDWVGSAAADIQAYLEAAPTPALTQRLTELLSGVPAALQAALGEALISFAEIGAGNLHQSNWPAVTALVTGLAQAKAEALVTALKTTFGTDYAAVERYFQLTGGAGLALTLTGRERATELGQYVEHYPLNITDTVVTLQIDDATIEAQGSSVLGNDGSESFETTLRRLFQQAAAQVITGFAASANEANPYTLTFENIFGWVYESAPGVADPSRLEDQFTVTDILALWPHLSGHVNGATVTNYSDLFDYLQLQGTLPEGAPDLASLGFELVLPALTAAQVQDMLAELVASGREQQWFYYDNFGQLRHTLDSAGTVRSTFYDAVGQVVGTRTAATSFWASNEAAGLTPGERPGLAAIEAFAGTPAAVFDGHGAAVYDALGRVAYAVDGNGRVAQFDYDALGHTLRETRSTTTLAAGAALDAASLAAWLEEEATAGRVALTDNVYAENRLRFTVDAGGYVTEYAYDALGNIVAESRFAETAAVRDYAGLVAFAADQRALHADSVRTAHSVYDAASRQRFAVDAEGYVTAYDYDVYGNVTAERRYAAAYGAEPYGIAALTAFYAGAQPDECRETRFFYNADGTVALTIDAGHALAFGYDRNGALVSTRRSQAPIDPLLLAEGGDAVVRALLAGTVASQGDYTVYDGGRPLYAIDAAGYLTAYRYDAQGQRLESRRYEAPLALRSLEQVLGSAPAAQPDAVELQHWQQLLQADRLASIALFLAGPAGERYTLEQRSAHDPANHRRFDVDALGVVTESGYDREGRLAYRTVYDGALVSQASLYDPAFDLAAFIAGGAFPGQTTRVHYDGAGQLQYTVDAAGQVLEERRDAFGNVVELRAYSQLLVDAASLPGSADFAQALAGAVQVSRFVYAADGRLLLHVDREGHATVYDYAEDGALRLTLRTAQPLEALPEPFDGMALMRILLAGETAVTAIFHGDFGRELYTLDAEGVLTVNRHDSQGLVVQVLRFGQATVLPTLAEVLGETPAAAPTEAQLLDWLQRLQLAQRAALDALVAAAQTSDYSQAERTVYAGGRRFSIDAQGGVTERVYRGDGLLSQRIVYAGLAVTPAQLADGGFDLAAFVDGAAAVNQRERYHYDAEGGLALIERHERIGDVVQSAAYYDGQGRLRFSVDALQTVQELRYHANGNLAERIEYRERLAAVDSRDLAGLTPMVVHRHDSEGRLRYTVNALGEVEEQRYDAAGNVIQRLRYAERLVSIDSHDYGALVEANARRERYVYDEANRLRYAIDAEGYVKETRYDGEGRVAAEVQWLNDPALIPAAAALAEQDLLVALDGAVFQETLYNYDAAGNLTVVDALNQSEVFVYDAEGRVVSQTTRDGGVWTYTYDAEGRLETKTSPVVAVTVPGAEPESVSQSLVTRYTYDAAGNLLSETQADGTAFERTLSFTYDAYNRLLSATRTGSEAVTGFSWDGVEHAFVAARAPAMVARQQWYDARGNVVVSVDEDGAYSYRVYDDSDQLRYEVDAERFVTRYTYDAYGNIQTLTRHANAIDLDGHTPSQALTMAAVQGLVAAVTTSLHDRTLTYVYDALGREIERIQPQSFRVTVDGLGGSVSATGEWPQVVTRTAYNAFGEVVSTADSVRIGGTPSTAERQVSYAYNARGERIAQVDADLYRTEWEYDAAGNVTRVIEYADALTARDATPVTAVQDRVTERTYDLRNQLLTESRLNVDYFNGGAMVTATATSSYEYDAAGRISKITTATGAITTFTYDALGRLLTVTEPTRALDDAEPPATATPVTRYAYDAFGNAVRETRESGHAGGPSDIIIERRFDALGNVTWEQDALGQLTEFSYDNAGNLLRSWYLQDAETLVQTVYGYDSRSNQVAAAQSFVDAAGTHAVAGDRWQRFNAFGELEAKGVGGDTFEFFEYDQTGQLLRSNAGDGVVRLYGYDDYGRIALMAMDSTAANFAGVASLQALFMTGTWQAHSHALLAYGDGGEVTESGFATDTPAGALTVKTVDRWGNVVREQGPRGEEVTYVYDDDNRLIETTVHGIDYIDPGTLADIEGGDITTRVYYDLAGNQRGTRDANGNDRLKTYNAAGQMLAEGNAYGQQTRYSYDGFGRVLTETSPLERVRTNSYDANGRLVETESGVEHQSFGYDRLGQRTTVVEHYTSGDRTTAYRYDLRGNLVQSRTPDGLVTAYSYDAFGNKTGEVVTFDDGTPPPLAVSTQSWGYASGYFGLSGWFTDKAGATTHYSYGAGLRLASESHAGGATKTYTYDGAGRLVTIIEVDGGITSATSYEYDAAGNRTREKYARGVTVVSGVVSGGTVYQDAALSYDLANRLTAMHDTGAARPATQIAYHYDAAGNRIAVEDVLEEHTEWYSYDAEGRVYIGQGTKTGSAIGLDTVTPNSTVTVYDAEGKRTWAQFIEDGYTIVEVYVYDADGRLFEVTRNDHLYSRQTYDDRGRVASLSRYAGAAYLISTATYEYDFDAVTGRYTDTVTTEMEPVDNNDIDIETNATTGAYTVFVNDLATTTTSVITSVRDAAGRLLSTHSEQTSHTTGTVAISEYNAAQVMQGPVQVEDIDNTQVLETETTHAYSGGSGRVQTVASTATDGDAAVGQLDSDTATYGYDGYGQLVRVQRSSQPGHDTTYINNADGQVLVRFERDGAASFYLANGHAVAERYVQTATSGSIAVATGEVVVEPDRMVAPGEYTTNPKAVFVDALIRSAGLLNVPFPQHFLDQGINFSTEEHWQAFVHARAVAEARAVVDYLQSLSPAAREAAIAKLQTDGIAIALEVGIGSLEEVGTDELDAPLTIDGFTYPTGWPVEVLGQQDKVTVTRTLPVLKLEGDSEADLYNFLLQTVVGAIHRGVVNMFWDTVSGGGYILPFVQDFEFSFSAGFAAAADASIDTDPAYQAIATGADADLGTYTVQAGDTLQALALGVYGNASLWYLIADRNGLSGAEALVPGQRLVLPNAVSGANGIGSYQAYAAGDVMGDVAPQLALASPGAAPVYDLPTAPRHKPPTGLAAIFAMIAAVFVALLVGIFTAGAGMLLLTSSIGLLGASVAAGAVSGTVSSLASQGVMVSTGLQEKLDWAQVGVDTLISGLTMGIGTKLYQAVNGAGRVGQMVQAINRAAGYSTALRYAGHAGMNAALGLGAGTAAEGLMKAIDPRREVNWVHVAALSLALDGALSLLGRPAKHLPNGEDALSDLRFRFLPGDGAAADGPPVQLVVPPRPAGAAGPTTYLFGAQQDIATVMAIQQAASKPGSNRVVLADEAAVKALVASGGIGKDDKFLLFAHGKAGSDWIGDKRTEEIVDLFRPADGKPYSVAAFGVVACGRSVTDPDRIYMEGLGVKLGALLEGAGVNVGRITRPTRPVMVGEDGRRYQLTADGRIVNKGADGKTEAYKDAMTGEWVEHGARLAMQPRYQGPGTEYVPPRGVSFVSTDASPRARPEPVPGRPQRARRQTIRSAEEAAHIVQQAELAQPRQAVPPGRFNWLGDDIKIALDKGDDLERFTRYLKDGVPLAVLQARAEPAQIQRSDPALLAEYPKDYRAMDVDQVIASFNTEREFYGPTGLPTALPKHPGDDGRVSSVLFRADPRPPEVVFSEGFTPKHTPRYAREPSNFDVRAYQIDSNVPYGLSGFFSASATPYGAGRFLISPDAQERLKPKIDRYFDEFVVKKRAIGDHLEEARSILEDPEARRLLNRSIADREFSNDNADIENTLMEVPRRFWPAEQGFAVGVSYMYAFATPKGRVYEQNTNPVPPYPSNNSGFLQRQQEMSVWGSVDGSQVIGVMKMVVMSYEQVQLRMLSNIPNASGGVSDKPVSFGGIPVGRFQVNGRFDGRTWGPDQQQPAPRLRPKL